MNVPDSWLKAIFYAADALAFIITDLAGEQAKIVAFSPGAENMLGYEADQVISKPVAILHQPEDVARFPEVLASMKDNARGFQGQTTLIRADGSKMPVLFSTFPIMDQAGTMVAAFGISQDISKQVRAEEQLRLSEAELQTTNKLLDSVLNAIQDVIGIQDTSHGIVRYNKAGLQFLGLKQEEAQGKKCFSLIGRTSICEDCATLKVMQTKQAAQAERYVPELNKWLDCRSYPVFDDSGKLVNIVEHLRDISEQKRMEAELVQSNKRFEDLVRRIPIGVFTSHASADGKRSFSYISENMAHLVGKSVAEIAADHRQAFEAVHPDDAASMLEATESSIEKRSYFSWEGRYVVDAEVRWLHLESIPRIHADGSCSWDGVVQDITDRKTTEEKLRLAEHKLQQAQKMQAIGQLAGGIAHDFNNQLVGVMGYADFLRMELKERPHLYAYADKIIKTSKRAADVTSQLLAFARKGKYLDETIDVHNLIEEIMNILRHSVDKRIELKQVCQATNRFIKGDPSQLQTAFLNIALNASDAMPKGGSLVISTELVEVDAAFCKKHSVDLGPGTYVCVRFEDSGYGIEPAIVPRVFEPFFTTKSPGKGTGLGLAAVYGIVTSHMGAVTLHSTYNQGTTVLMYLPALRDAQLASGEIHDVGKGRSARHILLVDDEAIVCEVVQEMLTALNYKVTVCRNGKQALEFYEQGWANVDLVILDMVMPVMGGKETFIAMQKINPEVKVLLASGYSMGGEAQEILQLGVKGFVQKPFRVKDLSARIDSTLESDSV